MMKRALFLLSALGCSGAVAADDPLACQPNDEFPMLCVRNTMEAIAQLHALNPLAGACVKGQHFT